MLGLPRDRETVRIANRDHRGISKFSGADDPEWMILAENILEAANTAAATNYLTPSMKYRQAMFDSSETQDAGRSLSNFGQWNACSAFCADT